MVKRSRSDTKREEERNAGLLSRRFAALDGTLIEYGVAGEHPSGMGAGDLANILIKGTDTSPPRDFMEVAEGEAKIAVDRGMRLAAQAVLRGADPRPSLARARDAAHEAVVRAIDGFTSPSNAASTIAAKGKDDPLTEKGDLLDLSFAGFAVGRVAREVPR